jgi:hypothetical protein
VFRRRPLAPQQSCLNYDISIIVFVIVSGAPGSLPSVRDVIVILLVSRSVSLL